MLVLASRDSILIICLFSELSLLYTFSVISHKGYLIMKKRYSISLLVTIMCLLTQTDVIAKETHKENKPQVKYIEASQLSDAERKANKVTYQEYLAVFSEANSASNKKEKHSSISQKMDAEGNSKPNHEEIEVIKLYTEIYEDLSFPPPPDRYQGEPVSNYITVAMDVDLIKDKIKNKQIGIIKVFNVNGDALSFEYSGIYFDEKYPETFSAGFRNKTGRLTLSGHYGDTNFRGQFMDRGHTTNILIRNNKGYVYSVNRPRLELRNDWLREKEERKQLLENITSLATNYTIDMYDTINIEESLFYDFLISRTKSYSPQVEINHYVVLHSPITSSELKLLSEEIFTNEENKDFTMELPYYTTAGSYESLIMKNCRKHNLSISCENDESLHKLTYNINKDSGGEFIYIRISGNPMKPLDNTRPETHYLIKEGEILMFNFLNEDFSANWL